MKKKRNTKAKQIIFDALLENPNLSARAIAGMYGVGVSTASKYKAMFNKCAGQLNSNKMLMSEVAQIQMGIEPTDREIKNNRLMFMMGVIMGLAMCAVYEFITTIPAGV